MTKNILVSAVSGLIGYGIARSIKGNDPYYVIGTSIFEDSPAIAFSDTFVKAVKTSDEKYIPWLIETIKKYNIDLIIPGYDEDVSKWNQYRDIIGQTGTKIMLNNKDLIELCDDKWTFYQVLKQHNSRHAIATSLSDDYEELVSYFGEIMLVKPRHGDGSKGIAKISSIGEFNEYRDLIGKNLMVQEFIGNLEEEYTTTAFCDGQGSYYTIISLRRKLTKQGYTGFAEVVFNKKIEEAVHNICKIFKPIGPTNFQFRNHNGVYKLLEINARLSSATSMRRAFGYNDPLMAVEYFLNGTIPEQPDIRTGKAIRYIEDYIIYS